MHPFPRILTLSVRATVAALVLAAPVGCAGDPAATTSDSAAPEPASQPTPAPNDEAEIIAYAGGESAGYLVRTRADARRMSEAPVGFRDFIGPEAERIVAGAGCDSPDVGANVEFVSTDGWAIGSVNECGGYRAIWGTVDGAWEQVLGTQDSYECAVLETYRIPSDIAGDTCFDYGAGEALDYDQG